MDISEVFREFLKNDNNFSIILKYLPLKEDVTLSFNYLKFPKFAHEHFKPLLQMAHKHLTTLCDQNFWASYELSHT